MTHQPTPKPPRLAKRTKTLLVLLVISGLLNVALIGFITTRAARNFSGAFVKTSYEEGMPQQVQDAFASELKGSRRELLRALRDLRQARTRQHEILTAHKLDADAFKVAQQDVSASVQTLLNLTQDTFLTTASKLPDDIRQQIPQPKLWRALAGSLKEKPATTGDTSNQGD